MDGPRKPPRRPASGSVATAPRAERAPRAAAPTPTRKTKPTPKAKPTQKAKPTTTKSDRADRSALGRVDGVRGQRDGAGTVQRRRRLRTRGRVVAALAVTVLLVGVLFVAVFPTTTLLHQRRDVAKAQAELADLQAEGANVKRQTARFNTDAEIEAQARANGMVRPGDEAFNILPTPIDPVGLPTVWPFTGVEQALGAR